MGSRAFALSLALIVGLVALSTTRAFGAMMGLLCGVSVAFFLAPIAFGLQGLVHQVGLSLAFEQLVHLLLLVYGLCVLFAVVRASGFARAGCRARPCMR
jgi:hypothetical protein